MKGKLSLILLQIRHSGYLRQSCYLLLLFVIRQLKLNIYLCAVKTSRIQTMRHLLLLIISIIFPALMLARSYTQYVNPFIGTGALHNSLLGNCYPGATVPFGMVQVGPDTREAPSWDCAPGYDYNDSVIYGFSHTRLSGTGVSDLIDIMLMPFNGERSDICVATFSHADEEAHPGYYRVWLKNSRIMAELSATTHMGVHYYQFQHQGKHQILLDLNHSAKKGDWGRRIIQSQIHLVSPTVVEGYRLITGWAKLRKVCFHIEFSEPIVSFSLTDGSRSDSIGKVINGEQLKAFLNFGNAKKVMAKVALSPVSIENAHANMLAESTSWLFDDYRKQADHEWNLMLGRVEASADSIILTKFYTALYHTLIQPNIMSDVNGEYMAPDYTVRKLPQGESWYSTFSLWDTFRAAHPLYNILYPDYNKQFINSMLLHAKYYGYLPIWQLWGQENYCMIGNHSIPVIADAYLHGGLDIDGGSLLHVMERSLSTSHPNYPSALWDKYGYFPEDLQSQSVSLTLETCFDDWCVAQVARQLHRSGEEQQFTRKALNYSNLFNPDNGFFQARTSSGQWVEPFNALKYGANGGNPYTEGNAWQYLWYVPHHINGLIRLLGGKKQFEKKLDTFFTLTDSTIQKNDNASGFIGQYIHGNEPDQHVAYLYNYIGKPEKTRKLVKEIASRFYTTASDGYAGNDDCGEMSAWYVFSAMGFYPVCPASGRYDIGVPLLNKVILHLTNGKSFTVTATKLSPAYKGTVITYDDIMQGINIYLKP